ncbi:MAG: carbamoyl-phosphate synthase large subunit [Chloroflexi bacterium]|nr:carbamoyl-phosphate synthase large subunit [Chloroflexota bacterium]
MPKRSDIQTILVIGSGPIVIGQACEFDYSGVQACKVLRREGYRVVLVNSNPATIMTDPQFADATYIEPLTPEVLEKIIVIERPDAVLPTVGGQTGLNLAMRLHQLGILARHGVQLIGASPAAIELAEDRQRFKEAMIAAGLGIPPGETVTSVAGAVDAAERIGYPVLIRPSFTLGGSGGGIAYDQAQLREIADRGLRASPVTQVLIEQSVLGWKEYELEVMRDCADNFVVVCSIENLDPMGVHTGDSITVAPAMTLTDRELQRLRDIARIVIRTVGVETGGSNIQFAVDPANGQVVVIEMNPRVSRSSALASKATGFPIAKIAALLAVGYTLDEIQNDITRVTPASFEPSLDYVVVKIPRWAFEKFPGADPVLGPQMKSVGEVMAIGATFTEAFQKALRSLETGALGFGMRRNRQAPLPGTDWQPLLATPTPERIGHVAEALRAGWSIEQVCAATRYDPWFVDQLSQLIELEAGLARTPLHAITAELWREVKGHGFGDAQIAAIVAASEADVRRQRIAHGVMPVYRRIDTCAAEFAAHTPYLYSSYSSHDEAAVTDRPKVMVLGGGPNRIGQGIEFDYCCVHACMALRDLGYETIMVNCNPETVSTDYDTSDRLYFEPLTLEDVLNIWEHESRHAAGQPVPALVQFGGQTPLNLARGLEAAGVPIWGTSTDAIDLAEDRGRFGALMRQLDVAQPESGMADDLTTARAVAQRIGYPVLVRPSYVLGGRAMAIAYDDASLAEYLREASAISAGQPVLIDRYLEDAFEIDVDAVGDGDQIVIGGIMEHIEEAGVHSGDSAMVMPPYKVSAYHLAIIRDETVRIGKALRVRGLMNIQYAILDDEVYVLEVNPRSSRTVPFVAKATGVPLARIAAQAAAGRTLAELGLTVEPPLDGFFVKEAVLPFDKFPGAAVHLSPEMRSTGEVMGHAASFGHAFAKAQMGAGQRIPTSGGVLLTVNDFDKGAIVRIARDLVKLGFTIYATHGTTGWLNGVGIPAEAVNKVSQGGFTTVDLIAQGRVGLVVSTPLGPQAYADGQAIRSAAIRYGVLLVTTLTAAAAMVPAIRALQHADLRVRSLQHHHALQRHRAE